MDTAPLLLALDQGTTSTRAMLFSAEGAVEFEARRPLSATYPQPGWVSQDPTEIIETVLATGREAVAWADRAGRRIAGVGITNQRETAVLWERESGRPVAPAIVWQSRQSAPQVEQLAAAGHASRIQHVTGLVPDASFSATKLMWLFDYDSTLRSRAENGDLCFGTVDSWMCWHLLEGRHVTDRTNASHTMLMDLATGNWSSEMLAVCDISAAVLPEILDTWGPIGEVPASVLGVAMPLGGIIGDQQSALFGQACLLPGQAKNTYGTGAFLLLNTGGSIPRSAHGMLATVALSHAGTTSYASEGAVLVTGSAVQWLRDGLGVIRQAEDVEPLAASVPDSGGVVFVPALTGLGGPYWDPGARGTMLGLTRGTTTAHIARATLEGLAYQTRDVIDAMEKDTGIRLTELRVDGGATRNDLLMQIQADVLGVPVVRPRNTETTAWGAAALAGLTAGVIASPDRLAAEWQEERRFNPNLGSDLAEHGYQRWQRAVERAGGWAVEGD